MSLVFYYAPMSTASITELILEELGVPCERVKLDFTRNTMNWYPDDQKNAKAGEVAKADIADCLRILNGSLEGKQYLVGDYTLADAHLTSFSDWLRHMKIDFTAFPHVNAWSDRCRARPAYTKLNAALGG